MTRVMDRAVRATVAEARVMDKAVRVKVMAAARAVRTTAMVKARAARGAVWVRDRARVVMARAWARLDRDRAEDPVVVRARGQARAIPSNINTRTSTATVMAVAAAWGHVTDPDRAWARDRASSALCSQPPRVRHR